MLGNISWHATALLPQEGARLPQDGMRRLCFAMLRRTSHDRDTTPRERSQLSKGSYLLTSRALNTPNIALKPNGFRSQTAHVIGWTPTRPQSA